MRKLKLREATVCAFNNYSWSCASVPDSVVDQGHRTNQQLSPRSGDLLQETPLPPFLSPSSRRCDSGHVHHMSSSCRSGVDSAPACTPSRSHVQVMVRSGVGAARKGRETTAPLFVFFIRKDMLISDFWSLALETINTCLTKHLEQLKAPVGTLSEALGNLLLDSSPEDSDAAPGSILRETLLTGTCHWKCVCYGIGNFSTCVIARNQLTFLLLFLEKCQIPRSHCCVYDPLFSQLEIAVLNTLGVIVLSENEEGKRSIRGERTIFYMLHCGTALYNNLLWSNWSVEALSKMVIIGNSFRGLEDRLLTRILQKNYPYIAKILQGLEEQEFPLTSQYTDMFNDTAVHWFPVQKLSQLSAPTWAFREEPDYQDCEDLEIIRNKTQDPSATDSNSL